MAGIRVWDIIIFSIILLGIIFFVVFFRRFMRNGGRRQTNLEETDVIKEIKKELYEQKVESKALNLMTVEKFTEVTKKLNNTFSSMESMYLSLLRTKVYSTNLPIKERMAAFIEYIKCGGDGLTTEFVLMNLILPHRNEWLSFFVEPEDLSSIRYLEHYQAKLAFIEQKLR